MAYSVVDISEAMVEISKLSTGELKDLCNCSSDERYDQLVEQSQRVSSHLNYLIQCKYSSSFGLTLSPLVNLLLRRSRASKLSVKC